MAYTRKGWRFWVPVIASALGFLIGTSILICFQTVYNNFHAAAWGGASGVLSGLTFILHLAVRFDYRMKLNPDIFTTLMTVGIFGIISGFGAVIGYLVKGIMKKESVPQYLIVQQDNLTMEIFACLAKIHFDVVWVQFIPGGQAME